MLDPRRGADGANGNAASVAEITIATTAEQAVWMRTALHDLAQPLTALECVLFLTTLEPEADVPQLRQAIADGLVQCRRMTADVRTMQERLQNAR